MQSTCGPRRVRCRPDGSGRHHCEARVRPSPGPRKVPRMSDPSTRPPLGAWARSTARSVRRGPSPRRRPLSPKGARPVRGGPQTRRPARALTSLSTWVRPTRATPWAPGDAAAPRRRSEASGGAAMHDALGAGVATDGERVADARPVVRVADVVDDIDGRDGVAAGCFDVHDEY